MNYAGVALMPAYAYYSQMMLIRQEKSLGSFSIYVCAILLISNILRIFFWLTIGYAVNLLFQSICIIAIMVTTGPHSYFCSKTAWSCRITVGLRRRAWSKGSGSGRPMKNIVSHTICSQVFISLDGFYDHTHPLPPTLQFEQVWRSNWVFLDEHWGYFGIPSGYFKPYD